MPLWLTPAREATAVEGRSQLHPRYCFLETLIDRQNRLRASFQCDKNQSGRSTAHPQSQDCGSPIQVWRAVVGQTPELSSCYPGLPCNVDCGRTCGFRRAIDAAERDSLTVQGS